MIHQFLSSPPRFFRFWRTTEFCSKNCPKVCRNVLFVKSRRETMSDSEEKVQTKQTSLEDSSGDESSSEAVVEKNEFSSRDGEPVNRPRKVGQKSSKVSLTRRSQSSCSDLIEFDRIWVWPVVWHILNILNENQNKSEQVCLDWLFILYRIWEDGSSNSNPVWLFCGFIWI